jgi:DNA-binding NtrC family response regulator
MASETLLVVDDDPLIRGSLYEMLQGKGYQVEMASDGREALSHLGKRSFNLVLTDWKMPEVDGFSLLDQIRTNHPKSAVVIITGFGSVDSAVEAMRRGAIDFLTKPIQPHELEETIQRALEHIREPVETPAPGDPFSDLIGKHASILKLREIINLVAASPTTVLLEGESGTGKRVVAHAIHRSDPKRWDGPFVEVSCSALPETLLESELFGHVRGAFTGAIRDKQGRFELANKGTILLDEIDSFSPALQVKLLRVLQERTFERVGDSKTLKVDVRIIAATNRNLQELVKNGKFREDLYYRLNVISFRIPPLRERVSDIPILVDYFLKKACAQAEKSIHGVSDEAMKLLCNYSWPGNVRELENAIERTVILAQHQKIMPQDLPESVHNSHPVFYKQQEVISTVAASEMPASLKKAMQDPEREIIVRALAEANGNRSLAAKRLGIHRSTLYHKLKKLSLDTDQP